MKLETDKRLHQYESKKDIFLGDPTLSKIVDEELSCHVYVQWSIFASSTCTCNDSFLSLVFLLEIKCKCK